MTIYIKLAPIVSRDRISVSTEGDTITINNGSYDLSVIPDGATLPNAQEATGCEYFVGDIERIDGELHITLLLPIAEKAGQEACFPAPIAVEQDGVVELPNVENVEEEIDDQP